MGTLSEKALENLKEMSFTVKDDPQRPVYHFLPPAFWMNDPNAPLFYRGEYHLFYQFNPFDDKWGDIHWGHAKSKDLIHWEHLPVALEPSEEKDETHCFSGDCIINKGIPTIIYTSIGPDKLPKGGAEQWMALGDKDMVNWTKYKENPIMTLDIHEELEIEDWRDPFIWKEDDCWYAVLGGHLTKPTRPAVFLYKSGDLYNWDFLKPLIVESRKRGKNFECPNFFKMGNKYVLIVSPHKRVLYSVGEFKEGKFLPGKWNILDYGTFFYATNILKDKKNDRIILFGWVQGGGDISGWNGCLSLPRVISLDDRDVLTITPLPELKLLRDEHFQFKKQKIGEDLPILPKGAYESTLEIKTKIKNISSEVFYFKLYDQEKVDRKNSFGFDFHKKRFWVGKEKAKLDLFRDTEVMNLHIFIDHSIFEVYINDNICLTSKIALKNQKAFSPIISSKSGTIHIIKMDIWTMNSIWSS